MRVFALLHKAIETLRVVFPIRQLGRWAYSRHFAKATDTHLFHGVYSSFLEAQAAIPPKRLVGYNNPEAAKMYLNRLHKDDYDYPAMFWIESSLHQGYRSIVDLGGSVGVKYYAFSRMISFPRDLRWTVVDVPFVAAEGKALALELKVPEGHLNFTSSNTEIEGVDLLYASGVLQYLPHALWELLDDLNQKPRRILINTTPLHDSKSFFTVNNIGVALCPYRVTSRDEFVRNLESRGYKMRDRWLNISKQLLLPWEHARNVNHYSGYCFDRE